MKPPQGRGSGREAAATFGQSRQKMSRLTPAATARIVYAAFGLCAMLNLLAGLSPATAALPRRPPAIRTRRDLSTATELPDGADPPAGCRRKFHHRADVPSPARNDGRKRNVPQGTVYNFTMSSADSKIYPGIARDRGTFGTPDPNRPCQTHRDHQPSGALHPSRGGLCSQTICPRDRRAIHCRSGRARPSVVHGAG